MASAFGHALASIAIGNSFKKELYNLKFWILGIFCSIVPDLDVIGFSFGIEYGSFWGHRGFSHSIFFAILLGITITLLFYRKVKERTSKIMLGLFFTLSTVSHSVLDALTSGGLGVAFFSPFNDDRFFFPWRPIQVSPIGIDKFLSEWGLRVILSELIWIGIPCILWIFSFKLYRKFKGKS